MSDKVKIAAIVAVAVVPVVGLYLYFSPYQSCVRAMKAAGDKPDEAALLCLEVGASR